MTKGYTSDPKRYSPCCLAGKTERYGDGGDSYRPPRQMFPAVCAECGKETEAGQLDG